MRQNKEIIDAVLSGLATFIGSHAVDGQARDVVLQLFTKNIGNLTFLSFVQHVD